jgi:5'-nucleotidase
VKKIQIVLACAIVLAMSLGATLASARPDERAAAKAPVQVQLLSFNDFHGQLETPSGSGGRIGTVDAGGAEYFATHIRNLEATNPNTLVVGAGDMIGATPLLSALFHDEPTIESLGLAGLDVTSVGNHEFDEGATELRRMQRGGCHPTDGCQDGDAFAGAQFQYLAANVEVAVTTAQRNAYTRALARYRNAVKAKARACKANRSSRACKRKLTRPAAPTARPMFPATSVKTVGGVRIGFIGMTLEGTPQLVTPSGVAGLRFRDEVATANRYVAALKRNRVETIVVLLHEGGLQTGTYNECVGISGAINAIVQGLNDDVDVVVSGHTHQAYNCTIDGKLVTSAASASRVITDIDLTIESTTGEVTAKTATNRIVTRDVPRDSAQTALLNKYRALAAPLANRVIGSITSDITRAQNAAGESALGDVIADAQLADTRAADRGNAVVAFMNPGGIRTDLIFGQISGGEAPGQVTYGESFAVQPFGNNLVTMTLTGAQIDTLLEQQWSGVGNTTSPKVLQVSNGFTYTWDASRAIGDRVDPATIRINGTAVSPSGQYRVTVNSFLADGGDGFAVLRDGASRLGGVVDTDALESYFRANSPVAPGPRNRITRVN